MNTKMRTIYAVTEEWTQDDTFPMNELDGCHIPRNCHEEQLCYTMACAKYWYQVACVCDQDLVAYNFRKVKTRVMSREDNIPNWKTIHVWCLCKDEKWRHLGFWQIRILERALYEEDCG